MDVHELVEKVADGLPVKKDFVRHLIKKMVAEISQALTRGEAVHIREFGRFATAKVAQRIRRHPKTGVKSMWPATTSVKFRPAVKLRTMVAAKRTPVKP